MTADPFAEHASRRDKRSLPRNIAAGAFAALATIAVPLTLGLLAFAPLGAAAPRVGIPAAVFAASIGALVFAWRGRSVMPAASIGAAMALIVTNLVQVLARDPALALPSPQGIAIVVAAVATAVIGAGVAQVLLGLVRAGAIAKYVPQPVLAGFILGVALLIALSQVPSLLGVDPAAFHEMHRLMLDAHSGALLVGSFTALVILVFAWRAPRMPALLIGLLAGSLLDFWLQSSATGMRLGARIGELPTALPLPTALTPWLDAEAGTILLRHLPQILSTAAVLTIMGSLESVLGARATDQEEGTRHDPNAELVSLGLTNVVCGVFGGLPVVYLRSRAAVVLAMHGRGRVAAAACGAATGLLFLLGSPWLARLSLPVLAGVMLVIALGLVDRWTRELVGKLVAGQRSRELWASLVITLVVCAITVVFGFVAGVAAGVVVAMLVFMHAMNRTLVRSRYTGATQPSRRVYLPEQEAILRPLRARVRILGLEGALFFGNVDRIVDELDTLPAHTRFVVLDLSRISTIDATGAIALARAADELAAGGIDFAIAGITRDSRHGRALRALTGTHADGARRWFPDVDHAVEAAEFALLVESGLDHAQAPVPLENSALATGLGPRELAVLERNLDRESFPRDAVIFREGDVGDRLYVVAEGSVTVSRGGAGGDDLPRRFVSFSPGMIFGELALLDSAGRTADAIADTPCVLFTLTKDAVATIRAEDPVLSERLFVNIATHLAQRLRGAAAALATATR